MVKSTGMQTLTILGGGLAGAEAAWQAARRGVPVRLYEMRPERHTGAHLGGDLAELVCSNSLGSDLVDRAPGLLKEELTRLGSLLIACARQTATPAGRALAVDREAFAALVTQRISQHPLIQVVRAEVQAIPDGPLVIASGPLTSPALSQAISELLGSAHLYFYDAIAPLVLAESIDWNIVYRASRYGVVGEPQGDYLNCPFDPDQYARFVEALAQAERHPLQSFEGEIEHGVHAGEGIYFEACLPVEILARRDPKTLAFGPMRPVGLIDPRSGRWPHAVVQLRQDNLAGSLYNLVGFQTNLTVREQQRVFRMIPGLEQAEFVRYGQMHRNTFINSPLHLQPTLQMRKHPEIFFAGQISGAEGYVANIGTGLLAGWNAARLVLGQAPLALPETTMLGALCRYICQADPLTFQPMKANFGLLPELADAGRMGRRERSGRYSQRARQDLERFLVENPVES